MEKPSQDRKDNVVKVNDAKIALNIIRYTYRDKIVENYAETFKKELERRGATVELDMTKVPDCDFFIDLDCGRNKEGNLNFKYVEEKCPIPSAVWFIDSHGHPTSHKRMSPNYDLVYFCVWNKRDLFYKHPKAEWCPNATDAKWFNSTFITKPKYDFGFFGSKMGLDRAAPMVKICEREGWTYRVSQICPVNKHRWPATANAMGECKVLFNSGQKHDGPNLRVMESMALGLPLITEQDPKNGTEKLFNPYEHYLPYEAYTYNKLEDAMWQAMTATHDINAMATEASIEVHARHLISHRVDQILEGLLNDVK